MSVTSIQERAEELLEMVYAVDEVSLTASISDATVQELLTIAVKLYAGKLADEVVLFPFVGDEALTATEVGTTVGQMIRAADIDIFELVAWQSLLGN
jgi:hypothetical protein